MSNFAGYDHMQVCGPPGSFSTMRGDPLLAASPLGNDSFLVVGLEGGHSVRLARGSTATGTLDLAGSVVFDVGTGELSDIAIASAGVGGVQSVYFAAITDQLFTGRIGICGN